MGVDNPQSAADKPQRHPQRHSPPPPPLPCCWALVQQPHLQKMFQLACFHVNLCPRPGWEVLEESGMFMQVAIWKSSLGRGWHSASVFTCSLVLKLSPDCTGVDGTCELLFWCTGLRWGCWHVGTRPQSCIGVKSTCALVQRAGLPIRMQELDDFSTYTIAEMR